MFTILGGDGKEYGPVSADQLRSWIAAGRANLETKAKIEGSVEWRRLGDYPEFGGGASAGGAMPPLPPSLPDQNLAGRGARLGAALIDMVLTGIAITPGLVVMGGAFLKQVLEAKAGQEPDFSSLEIGKIVAGGALLAVFFLVLLGVQIWMISTRGQSIGKRLLGIRIVKFADGSNAGFVNGWLLRNFVNGIISSLPWIGGVYWLVDVCFIFGDARRCVHDQIAGTKVINA